MTTQERFMQHVEKTPECWLWTGSRNPNSGHGQFMMHVAGKNRPVAAHRVSYVLFIGAIPIKADVRRTCGVQNCVNPSHLCLLKEKTQQERFLEKVQMTPVCWKWSGPLSKRGYGRFKVWEGDRRGKTVAPHIISYEIFIGAIPEGMDVHHRCHVRSCVNPSHLELIPHADHTSLHRNITLGRSVTDG